jgi:hypothetical protein
MTPVFIVVGVALLGMLSASVGRVFFTQVHAL